MGGAVDPAHLVAQPFDEAARDEHRPFERIGTLAAKLEQHGAEQAVLRARQLRATVGAHEGASAERGLGVANRAEERRVGKERVSPGQSRWLVETRKKK